MMVKRYTTEDVLEILREKYRGEENAISLRGLADQLKKRFPEKYGMRHREGFTSAVGKIGVNLARKGLIKRKVELGGIWLWVED